MPPEFHSIYDAVSGSTWIADGARPIARVEATRLRDLTLRPGGGPPVTWLTLFWWQYADNERPGRSAWISDQLSLDDHDPACFRLSLRAHNSGRSVESRCQLALTYDVTLDSYVYEVSTELEVQAGQQWIVEPQGGVEFVNPWYKEAVGAAVQSPGSLPPRWPWVLHTDAQGQIVRLPLNHLGSPALERIHFPARGGWLGFFNHPQGNPVIELDAETAAATRVEVCAWGYDAHFILRIPPGTAWNEVPLEREASYPPVVLSGGQKLAARYRLYSLPAAEGERLLRRSVAVALPPSLVERLSRPAVRLPNNTFQEGITPERPDSAWYWSPSHADGLTWERSYGRLDDSSLYVHNTQACLACWETPLGADFWMAPLPAQPQRLSGWIRTRRVRGRGAYLSLRYSSYLSETGRQPRLVETTSPLVQGDSDWTHVELVAGPPPPGATRAYLRLALDGEGEAWFDDVTLETVA